MCSAAHIRARLATADPFDDGGARHDDLGVAADVSLDDVRRDTARVREAQCVAGADPHRAAGATDAHAVARRKG
jgi:hypothetical protein